MNNRPLLIVGLVLLGVGFVGALLLEALSPLGTATVSGAGRLRARGLGGAGTAAANGQRIYQTGRNPNGQMIGRSSIPVSEGALMMGGGGCASCHGANGRGSTVTMMMGYLEAPDVTYRSLTNEGYTDARIYRAIRYGIDENGKPLDAAMPRWQMSETEVRDVVAYLKELSGR